MSGGLSLFREVYSFSSGIIPERSLFWSCTWVAFIVCAFLVWLQEHLKAEAEHALRLQAEAELRQKSPKLFLEFSNSIVKTYNMTYSGLFLKNEGERAFNVELTADTQAGFTLLIDSPTLTIERDQDYPIMLRTAELKDKICYPIGGLLSSQIELLFDRLAQKGVDRSVVITMRCRDYDRKEYSAKSRIRQDAFNKPIWCEPI